MRSNTAPTLGVTASADERPEPTRITFGTAENPLTIEASAIPAAIVAHVINAALRVQIHVEDGMISPEGDAPSAQQALDDLDLALRVLAIEADPEMRRLTREKVQEQIAENRIRGSNLMAHAAALEIYAATRPRAWSSEKLNAGSLDPTGVR